MLTPLSRVINCATQRSNPLKELNHISIVLVEPSHPGNIGGCARALKNMGFANLVLVNPERFPSPQADWRASNALDVLDGARVVNSVEEAIADAANGQAAGEWR